MAKDTRAMTEGCMFVFVGLKKNKLDEIDLMRHTIACRPARLMIHR